jgi:hypothetical protein
MTRKPQLSEPVTWKVYRAAKKVISPGEVEAADERDTIEKAAKEFKVIASKLIVVQRR